MRLLSTRLYLILSSSRQICGQRENGVVIGYIIRLLRSEVLNAIKEALVVVLLKTRAFCNVCADFPRFRRLIIPLSSGSKAEWRFINKKRFVGLFRPEGEWTKRRRICSNRHSIISKRT
jgi:hypothetical protein